MSEINQSDTSERMGGEGLSLSAIARTALNRSIIDEPEKTVEELREILVNKPEGDERPFGPTEADKFIQAGEIQTLLQNLSSFRGLGSLVAHEIIDYEHSGTFEIGQAIEAFKGLDESIIYRLIDIGEEWIFHDNADYFVKGLDYTDIACKLAKTGNIKGVIRILGSYQDTDRNKVAHALIDSSEVSRFADNLEDFQILDSSVGYRLVDMGFGRAVLKNLYQFERIDHNKVAHKILDIGDTSLLAENLDALEGLDSSVAYRLLDISPGPSYRNSRAMIDNLDVFRNLDHNKVVHRFISRGEAREVKDSIRSFEGLKGSVLERLISSRLVNIEWVMKNLDMFSAISKKELSVVREFTGKDWVTEYPRGAQNESKKDLWFGRVSEIDPASGFDQQVFGRIVRLRLEQDPSKTIYDVALWLEDFGLPREACDVQRLLKERSSLDFDPNTVHEEVLQDPDIEKSFFEQILAMSSRVRQRLLLSSKNGFAEQAFFGLENQVLYKALTSVNYEGLSFYESNELSLDLLKSRAHEIIDEMDIDSSIVMGAEEIANLRKQIDDFIASDPDETQKISEIIQQLKVMGLRRKSYIDNTQSWLLKHVNSSAERLTNVWNHRPAALLEGVQDSAHDLEIWKLEKQLSDRLKESGVARGDILSEKKRSIREELLRALSVDGTLRAMVDMRGWLKELGSKKKMLPAETIDIDVSNSNKKPYRFEILAADDPRGFTIGEDTGCCMRLDGQAYSCIEAGYSLPNAGFVAVYAPLGNIAAQSFWYIHPEARDTLVLDSIEANEGRNKQRILEVYKTALTEYLKRNPKLGIKNVHVGSGSSDVSINHLHQVDPVPGISGVYTDAYTQRKLI